MNHQTASTSKETFARDLPVGLTDHQRTFAAVLGEALAQAWQRACQVSARSTNATPDDERINSPTN